MQKTPTHLKNSFQYEYLFLTISLIIFCVFIQTLNYNADTLFPFRYADAILNNGAVKILVQPGPRFFPDVFYAAIALIFTQNPANHFYLSILINGLLLIIATYYFFKYILKDKSISLYSTIAFILLLPTSFIVFQSRVLYIILIPGTHAFTATLSIFCLIFILKLFNHSKPNLTNYMAFILLIFLLSINNQIFIPMLSVPLLGSLAILKILSRKQFEVKPFVPAIAILILSILVSLYSNYFWEIFPNLHVKTNNNEYLNETISNWFIGAGGGFFEIVFSIKKTGIFFVLLITSIIVSSLITLQNIIHFKARKNEYDLISLFLNILNILLFISIISALWAINRGSFRYIPHIYIFSTLILLFNISSFKFFGFLKQKSMVAGIIISIFIICNVTNLFVNKKQYNFDKNSQYHFLLQHLETLKSEQIISNTGLSSYWVANSGTSNYGLKILPLMADATPNIHAIDLMSFWENNNQKNKFTFIVNRYLAFDNKWSINKQSLIKRFGQPANIIELAKNKNNKYEIYLYPNLNSNSIYNHLNHLINRYFHSSEITNN